MANDLSFQLLLHSDGLLLLSRTAPAHPRTGRPVVHRTEGAAALEPVHGTGRRYRGKNGEGSRDSACGVDALTSDCGLDVYTYELRDVCLLNTTSSPFIRLVLV